MATQRKRLIVDDGSDQEDIVKKVKIDDDEDLESEDIAIEEAEESGPDAVDAKVAINDDDYIFIDKLPNKVNQLQMLKKQVQSQDKIYRMRYFQEVCENAVKKSRVHDDAIPICTDVRYLDFQKLRDQQLNIAGKLFDVIMMDPPWQLSSSAPSRGVAIAYSSLSDEAISKMPIETLQQDGILLIWTINAKYKVTCKLLETWGYTLVDEIVWVKKTVNGKIAKGHGFYLQHAKENCLIGVKGNVDTEKFKQSVASDVIFSERRGQSQKPEEIYEYVEQFAPNGHYLEIFGRRNNIRKNWVTIGNEL